MEQKNRLIIIFLYFLVQELRRQKAAYWFSAMHYNPQLPLIFGNDE